MTGLRRHLRVCCALVERDGLVLACQRSSTMNMALKWEFPGGKIEPEETPVECLKRELREELGVEIAVVRQLPPVTHSYPDFNVTLFPYVCRLIQGEPALHEHAALVWLPSEALCRLDWCEADLPILASYRPTGR